jgi:hypothetical protein
MPFTGDTRFFPLVLQRARGALSDADVVEMRRFYDAVHARKQPFLHIVDARTAQRPDSLVRTKLSEMTATLLPETKQWQVANAIVLDSRLTAGVITALRWAVPAPVPEKYFGDISDAMTFIEEHARAKGMTISPDARAYVARLAKDLHAA